MTKSKIPSFDKFRMVSEGELLKAGKLFILVILVLTVVPVFAQSVDTAWVRRYNGPPGNSYDVANAIMVDSSGNVYVTGYSIGSETGEDYATIKYYSNGDTAWVRRYNGPANAMDDAYAIAVDDSGNIYVTGRSYGGRTCFDYATIMYYPNGDTAWVRRYNGSANADDVPCAIAVDGSGNVYVTGYSHSLGNGTFYDYATIKYYPGGDTAWVRIYDGPGNDDDEATAITVDGSGSVYITGYSYGSETFSDYATIKYYHNGDTVWVRRYNGPGNAWDKANALVVDGSGNVYVTGYSTGSGTSEDYATIKYYSNGDTAWVKRYNGPGNGADWADALGVDGSGSIYVTGSSYGIGTYSDYATIKYYYNGDTAWVRRHDGPGNDVDYAFALGVDGSGNIYATGSSCGSGTRSDYSTTKYYSNGDVAWERRYNGPANGDDYAFAMSLDGSGNVYVTGVSNDSDTSTDYATIKYVQFLCGDCNKDGVVDVGDVVYLINYLFKSGPSPLPILHAGDTNCDEMVDVGDVIFLINYLFKGGPEPSC